MYILILVTHREGAREFSFQSAKLVASSCEAMGHQVHYYDPDLGSDGFMRHLDDPLPSIRRPIAPSRYLEAILHPCMNSVDAVFNAIYHPLSLDGCLEQLLELKGLRIVGNDHRTHTLAQERHTSKRLLDNYLPVLSDLIIRRSYNAQTLSQIQELGPQVVIYPNRRFCEGERATVATDHEVSLQSQLNSYLEKYEELLIEPLHQGRYFSLAVIGEFCSEPFEITSQFYHLDGSKNSLAPKGEKNSPTPLTPQLTIQLQAYAKLAHQMIESDHSSHCEFLLDGSNRIFLIDIFTRPLLLSDSLFMKAANHSNISCQQLIELMFDLTWSRPPLSMATPVGCWNPSHLAKSTQTPYNPSNISHPLTPSYL